MAGNPDSGTLHPPRLAPIFAVTPSAPGTPVHSIQTMRRKSAGHSGPLTKILVANRGVSPFPTRVDRQRNDRAHCMRFLSAGNRDPCVQDCARARDAHRRHLLVRRSLVGTSSEGIFSVSRMPRQEWPLKRSLPRRMKRTRSARASPPLGLISRRTTSSESRCSMALT